MSGRLEIVPTTIQDAKIWIDRHHRHHGAPVSALFAVAVALNGEIVGIATVGRPIARNNADGWTVEVTRCCTDGTKNACSKLYGACWRAARALGWKRLITYTLDTEPGTSLRAVGWKVVGKTSGGSWNRKSRPRVDKAPLQVKMKWEVVS